MNKQCQCTFHPKQGKWLLVYTCNNVMSTAESTQSDTTTIPIEKSERNFCGTGTHKNNGYFTDDTSNHH